MYPVVVALLLVILYLGLLTATEEALRDAEKSHMDKVQEVVKETYLIPKIRMIYRKGYEAGMKREREIIRQKAEELRKAKEK